MDNSPNLALPYIVAAQAQKHVTHNEAIRGLDAIVQLTVLDKDLATPPGSPSDGNRYIIAASPTGAWAGHAGKVAAFQDGAWAIYTPHEGWRAWVADEDTLYFYNGSAWSAGLALLGINATADTTNRLTVKSPASLFDNVGAGHQQKINKAAAGDTASQLFQTNFSGRAEFGLTGDDNFHVKVSPDGTAWHEAMVVDRNTGNIGLGTAGPIYDLEVFKAGAPAGFRLFNSGSQNPDFQMFDTTAGGFGLFATAGTFNIYKVNSGGAFVTQWVKILSDGKFGVLTAAPSNAFSVEGIAAPESDNAYTLGTSGKRWSQVYAATGTINTSDARHKTDISDSPLGLAFVLALKPRAYPWLEGGTRVEWAEEPCEVEEPVTELGLVTVAEVEGGAVVERQVERAVPVYDRLPVVDAAGNPVMEPVEAEGEHGARVVVERPKQRLVQRMRKVAGARQVKREVVCEGSRTHYGLIAQEVRSALDAAGVGDFAGWVLADRSDANSQQGLRYDQFIAPLIKAVQELAGRVAALEGR